MKDKYSHQPIPLDMAIRLCNEIRVKNACKWYNVSARWCWLCEKRANGNPSKMGFTRKRYNRGCPQINARFAELYAST